jgi:hypothetical protein
MALRSSWRTTIKGITARITGNNGIAIEIANPIRAPRSAGNGCSSATFAEAVPKSARELLSGAARNSPSWPTRL